MFGFGKRKTSYEGILGVAVSVALSLRDDLGSTPDAVSLAAFEAAGLFGSAVSVGVAEHQLDQLKSHMFTAAAEIFGDTSGTKTNWLFSFDIAQKHLNTPGVRDASMPFFYERAKTLPWAMPDDDFGVYANGLSMAVNRMVREQSPRWKRGVFRP